MDTASCPSLWMAGVSERTRPLAHDVVADVAVVGAGYTGLSAALALRATGRSIVVLEREIAGFGASGRNAGHVTPTIGKDPPTLARLFGRERARGLVAVAQTAIAYLEEMIARHGIDCAYEPVGNVMAAVHSRQNSMIERAAQAAGALGLDGEILDEAEMRRRGLPASFTRGYLERRGGILHPGRYVRGLRRAALSAGVALYEQTPVLRVEDGAPLVVHTRDGRVRADSVVLATNAYTPELGWLRRALMPVHVYLFATAPLGERERAAIGWPGREGIYTAHEILESYRLTDDGRIVGGAKAARYRFGGRAPADKARTYAFLERTFRQRFPTLRDVAITHRWGGPIAFGLDFLPAVGRSGSRGTIYYSAGYAGHGVALASYAGRMLVDLMLGREGPGRALWDRRRIPLPPEPLRWVLFWTLTGLFRAIDARVDGAVRRRGPT